LNRKRICSTVVGATLLIVGCEPKRWTNDQFEGTWHVEANNPNATTGATLTLTRDGKFVATSVPATFLGINDGKHMLSGTGTWSIIQLDSAYDKRMQFTFTKVEGITLQNLPWGAQLLIQGSNKTPQLFYYVGDPDDGRKVVFRRE